MVKNIFCIIISLATLCSCQNSQKEKVTYVNYDNKETITQEGNSVNDDSAESVPCVAL